MIPILPNILQMGGHFTSMICGNLTILELGIGMLIYILFGSQYLGLVEYRDSGECQNLQNTEIPRFGRIPILVCV